MTREETSAICSECNGATSEIFEGYTCASCRVKQLEELLKMRAQKLDELNHWQKETFAEQEDCIEKKDMRITELNKELSEYRRYKWAFEMLVKEISKN